MSEGCPLRIELFGGLRVRLDGVAPVEFAPQQAGALLALLALDIKHNHTREALIERLWPEEDEETGRKRLRHCLHLLRRRFEEPPFECADLLLTTRATVRLH